MVSTRTANRKPTPVPKTMRFQPARVVNTSWANSRIEAGRRSRNWRYRSRRRPRARSGRSPSAARRARRWRRATANAAHRARGSTSCRARLRGAGSTRKARSRRAVRSAQSRRRSETPAAAASSERHPDQKNAEQRIDHAEEDSVTRHRGEVVDAAPERVKEIGRRDAAHYGSYGTCARADEKCEVAMALLLNRNGFTVKVRACGRGRKAPELLL